MGLNQHTIITVNPTITKINSTHLQCHCNTQNYAYMSVLSEKSETVKQKTIIVFENDDDYYAYQSYRHY